MAHVPHLRAPYSQESSPAIRVDELSFTNQNLDETVEHVVEDFDATMPSKSRRRPETPVRRPAPGELDETRPHSITEVAGRVMLEPVSAGYYNLTYACLLVPRFSSHYLTGDVSDRLSEWLPQICIAFGWRLEYLAVRPEYIQWVVNVPPASIAWLSHAHHAPADLGKNIYRVRPHEKGKSLRRLLGPGLSHHGRHPAPPTAAGQGLHQTDPHQAGIFTAQTIALSGGTVQFCPADEARCTSGSPGNKEIASHRSGSQ